MWSGRPMVSDKPLTRRIEIGPVGSDQYLESNPQKIKNEPAAQTSKRTMIRVIKDQRSANSVWKRTRTSG